MRVWRRQYAAVGVYIGGVNSACAYGNLSAAWFRSAAAMGWGMLPTYVGPQAPCWGTRARVINPGKAAAEGQAAGADAVSRRQALRPGPRVADLLRHGGLRRRPGCINAVLTFLGAWDRTVAAKGYLTGVYSSQDSGIDDMQAAAAARPARVHPAGRDLDRALGREGHARRRHPRLADRGPGEAVRGQPLRDRRRHHAQHRPGRGRRADGALITDGAADGGTSRGPGKPVRAKCRRLISSRHGPTQ